MGMINAILIPSDRTQDVRTVQYDDSDFTNLTALIFNGDRTGTFASTTISSPRGTVSFWYDDEGLFRLGTEKINDIINLRAMELWAFLENATIHDFGTPLVGDYVILGGADEDGNSLPAPDWVKELTFTWPNRYDFQASTEL